MVICDVIPPAVAEVVVSTDAADLAAVFEAGVSVAVWRRQPSAELQRFASEALSAYDMEQSLDLDASDPRITTTSPALAAAPGFAAFLADMTGLVTLFADITGAERVGWRLAALARSMCPRLHVDRVGLRLVCTYRGPGTEWLPGSAADRTFMGRGSGGRDDGESGLILDPAAIGRAAAFDVVLLKGEHWPGNAGNGAIHRSPAVAPGERRIVLTLDMLS